MSQGPDFLPPSAPEPPAPGTPEPRAWPTPQESRNWPPPHVPSPPATPQPTPAAPPPFPEPAPAAEEPDGSKDPHSWPPPHVATPPQKVIERPHPLTGLARSGIALVAGGYFVIRELLEGGPGFGDGFLFIGLGLLAVALIAGISGILTWRTTTFVADDEEFRIERNFVSQSSSKVDYTKVQSVDVAQPLIARLMGLAKVHIDVGGAGGLDIAFLSRARAESLRDHLVARMQRAQAPLAFPPPQASDGVPAPGDHPVGPLPGGPPPHALEEEIVTVPAGNLLLGTFISLGSVGALIGGGLLLLVAVLAQTPVTMLAAAIGIGGWVWNQTGRNWNFRMTRREGALRLTRGALSTTAQGLRPSRIQGIAIKQDILQRLTGLYQMSVTVLGYGDPTGDEKRTNAVVLPYGTWDEVLTVLRAIWPEVDLTQVQPHGQPDRARWLTPVSFTSHTWGIGEHVVVTQHGLLEQTRTIVPHRRMQSASVHQGPLQKMLKLATIEVHTTDGPVTQRLYHLDERVARQVFEEQVSRARAAREAG